MSPFRRSPRPVALLALTALAAGCVLPARADDLSDTRKAEVAKLRESVDPARLRRHVDFLAGPDLLGRAPDSDPSKVARGYLTAVFRELGLKPVFKDSFEQGGSDAGGRFVNVAGLLPGEKSDSEVVLVVAHYDHLGRRGGNLFPGADDNASGVALLLETARILAADKAPRRCGYLFLCPDAEETGLRGSKYFVANPPVPIERMRTAIVMDLVGADASPLLPGRVFVLGAEASDRLRTVVDAVPSGPKAKAARLSIGLIEAVPFAPGVVAAVSDYDAFRKAGRPFLFLSCSRSPRYHTPQDTPDTLDYAKMADIGRYLLEAAVRIAEHPAPVTCEPGRYDLAADLANVEEALATITKAGPGDTDPAVFAQLGKDLATVGELRTLHKAEGKLPADKLRRLQMITLRLQVSMWQPKSQVSLSF